MGLIVTEIKELRQRLKDFDAGKTSSEDLMAALHVYAQTERRMRLLVSAVALEAKMGMKAADGKTLKQITGDGDLDVEPELEDRTARRGRK